MRPNMKLQCSKCKLTKETNEFCTRHDRPRGYSSDCKACKAKHQITKYRANPKKYRLSYEKAQKARFKSAYGITQEQFQEMKIKQLNKCMICERHETRIDPRAQKVIELSVDHNHKTKKVRDLLCKDCNTAFGLLDENLQTILNMAEYAKKHQE